MYRFTVYRRFLFFVHEYAVFDNIREAENIVHTLNSINKPTVPYKIGVTFAPTVDSKE